jgi:aspartate/methionine/tyrosine aminotransferase
MARFPENDIITLVGAAPRFDLAESVGPDLRLDELLDAPGPDPVAGMALGYATAQGDARLRRAVAELNRVDPDDVVITVGAAHALFLSAFILCDGGDEAVTTTPGFPLTRNGLETVGARLRVLSLSFDGGYRLDVTALGGLLSERTRLVSLASPHNPSGVAIPPVALQEVLAVMAARCPHAYLLLDETYREAVFGANPVADSLASTNPRVISVASLSKCHGAPGLRLGWAITRDRELREQLLLGKFSTVISCSPVDEALALRVLERRDHIMSFRRRHLADGLARTADWVRDHGDLVEWVRPDAGPICCVRLRPSVFDDAAVARFFDALTRTGARVANGNWFGDEGRVFRLGFGALPTPDLEAALGIVATVLKQTAADAAARQPHAW